MQRNDGKDATVAVNAEKTPTIIATYGCHPESASYDWASADPDKAVSFDKKFTADFIWYTEKVINSAGYNFIYIQGNVSTVTSAPSLNLSRALTLIPMISLVFLFVNPLFGILLYKGI